jgi:hypothetical protein
MVVTGLYGVDDGVITVVRVTTPVDAAAQKPVYQSQYALSKAAEPKRNVSESQI